MTEQSKNRTTCTKTFQFKISTMYYKHLADEDSILSLYMQIVPVACLGFVCTLSQDNILCSTFSSIF